jgi:serine protease inhibitor
MRRLLVLLLAALVAASAEVAIGAPVTPKPKPVKPTPRAERTAVVRGQTEFAFDLYRRLATPVAPNVVLSPYGASTALSMVSAGARGRTRAQMARVLRHPLPPGRLHSALGALGRDLNAAGAGGEGQPILTTANALWVKPGYPVLPRFIGLKALGMRDAFDGMRADFGGTTRAEQLVITLARQAAFVIVDEKGTEAGAVTAVGIGPTSAPVTDVRLALDRPFLFLIRDRATGTVLFMGRVGDPLAG